MLEIFADLRGLLHVSEVYNDSWVFRMHYRLTTTCMLAFSIVVSASQYVGNPIDCIHTNDIPEDVVNTYCWIHSTYTIPSAFWKKTGFEVAHPGVDKTHDPLERRYHKYYQWVSFCLFFQAILFYIPRWLWKNWEAGKISTLRMDLNLGVQSDTDKKLKKKLLIDYLYSNLKQHNFWAYRYFFCEFLCLLNVTGQIILLDKFFDGTFFTYGIEVMSFADRDQEDRIDPMIYVFPRMTKCTFHKYGTSGNIENHDVLCILPLNIVNEKIYIFIWFWFLTLSLLSFIVVLYRFIIIFSPYIRAYVLRMRFRRVKKECIDAIIGRSYVGDWLLFYLLGQNIDSGAYKDVVHELAKKLGYRSRDTE